MNLSTLLGILEQKGQMEFTSPEIRPHGHTSALTVMSVLDLDIALGYAGYRMAHQEEIHEAEYALWVHYPWKSAFIYYGGELTCVQLNYSSAFVQFTKDILAANNQGPFVGP